METKLIKVGMEAEVLKLHLNNFMEVIKPHIRIDNPSSQRNITDIITYMQRPIFNNEEILTASFACIQSILSILTQYSECDEVKH